MKNHSKRGAGKQTIPARRPQTIDDLPDDRLVNALHLLRWLRVTGRPCHVGYRGPIHQIALDLKDCGFVTCRFDMVDFDNGTNVVAVRVELIGGWR